MSKSLLVAAAITCVAACQSGDNYLYKKYSSYAEYGYKDRVKDDGTYWLSFTGTRRTTEEQVKKFWHQHASNLCKGEYKVLSQQAEMQIWKENQYNSDAANASSRVVNVKKPFMKGTVACSKSS